MTKSPIFIEKVQETVLEGMPKGTKVTQVEAVDHDGTYPNSKPETFRFGQSQSQPVGNFVTHTADTLLLLRCNNMLRPDLDQWDSRAVDKATDCINVSLVGSSNLEHTPLWSPDALRRSSSQVVSHSIALESVKTEDFKRKE
ncbi:hypothetical protein L1887_62330 [Cichorium endivia]|nr:hypothetical protein L1887_62330 [Cichorium endivia]